MTAFLSRIDLYPFKSMDGVAVESSTFAPSGTLTNDRRWAMFDANDRVINSKTCSKLHQIRSTFSFAPSIIRIQTNGNDDHTFDLTSELNDLETHLSQFLDQSVTIRENMNAGFPDDTDSPGPTIISTATLETVAEWFAIPLDEVRRRFRTNLEIDGVEPFWEDQLFGPEEQTIRFRIGNVSLEGVNPCRRCVVPSRDSQTGSPTKQFQKRFATQRQSTLPEWAAADRFNHFYRLAVNTRLVDHLEGATITIGDSVVVES